MDNYEETLAAESLEGTSHESANKVEEDILNMTDEEFENKYGDIVATEQSTDNVVSPQETEVEVEIPGEEVSSPGIETNTTVIVSHDFWSTDFSDYSVMEGYSFIIAFVLIFSFLTRRF